MPSNNPRYIRLLLWSSLLLLTFYSSVASAAVTWDGGATTTSWTDAANWSTNAVPTSTDDVDIPASSGLVDASNLSVTVNSLFIGSGSTLKIANVGSAISLTAVNGVTNNGTIQINSVSTGGATLISSGTITNTAIGMITDSGTSITENYINGNVVNQGTITINKGMSFNKAGGVHTNSGLITLVGGASPPTLNTSGSLTNTSTGSIEGNGTLSTGVLITNEGTIRPGGVGAIGKLTFSGPFTHAAAGITEIEMQGQATAGVDYDQIVFGTQTDTYTLGGTLRVLLLSGFVPAIGNTFFVLDSSMVIAAIGQYSTYDYPALSGKMWSPAYNSSGLTLNVSSSVKTWISSAGGLWNTAGNWSPAGVPTDLNDVVIGDGCINCTVTLDTNATVASLSLGGSSTKQTLSISGNTLTLNNASSINTNGILNHSSGTITGPGSLTVNGAYNWSGGSMSGTGSTNIVSGATLTISGTSSVSLDTRTLNNSGTVVWANTNWMSFYNNATINNNTGGLFDIQNDQTMQNSSGGVFNNYGTFRKTVATATSTISIPFNNSGSVDIRSGTVSLSNGGTDTSPFTATSPGTLRFGGGTHNFNTGVSLGGTGAIVISTGTVNINTAITSTVPLTLSGGTLGGSGTLSVSGSSLTWTSGTMSGTGSTNILSGATLTISGTSSVSLDARTLNNSGTTALTNANWVYFYNNAAINNQVGALFDIRNDQTMQNSSGGVFNNYGTFRKTVATATSTIAIPFINSGNVEIQSGIVSLTSGTYTGPFTATSPGVLQFVSGTHNFDAGASLGGTGAMAINSGTVNINTPITTTVPLTLSGGTLGGSSALTVSGTSLTWTSGTMSGTGSTNILSGATLTISGSSGVYLDTRTLNNSGTTALTNTNWMYFYNNAAINNQAGGLFDIRNDQTMQNSSGGVFNNYGTFRKTVATATSTISIPFNNSGSVDIQSGTVSLNNGGTHTTGSLSATSPGTLRFGGGTHSIAAGNVGGTGTIDFSGGTTTIASGVTYFVTGVTSVTGATAAAFNTNAITVGLLVSSGTLTGSGVVSATTGTWTGGTMGGSGSTDVNGTLSISGASSVNVDTRTLNNNGTATWSGTGWMYFYNNGKFNNLVSGIFDIQSNVPMQNSSGGIFTNYGTFRKTVATGTTTIAIPFNNSGSVDIQSGIVSLNNGGTHTTGSFIATSPGTLRFSGGTHSIDAGNMGGTGTIDFSGGTATIASGVTYNVAGVTSVTGGAAAAAFNTNASTVGLVVLAGYLSGSGIVTVQTATWSGGYMSGTGSTVITSGGTLSISGTPSKHLDARLLNIAGTATWTGTGYMYFYNNGTINNQTGAFFDVQNDTNMSNSFGGLFNNSGTFRKTTAATGATTVGIPFNNNGAMDIQSGSVSLNSGGTGTGLFTATKPGTLVFSSATYTINSPASLSGTGGINFNNGGTTTIGTGVTYDVTGITTLSGSATVNFDNANSTTTGLNISDGYLSGSGIVTAQTATWNDGYMTGTGSTVIPSGGTLSISGTLSKNLDTRVLNIAGTATWGGSGPLYFYNNGTINNQTGSIFEVQSDVNMANSTGGIFNNSGTFRKTTTTGATALGIPFNNSGILDVQTGTVSPISALTNTGLIQGSGTLDVSSGTFTNNGAIDPAAPGTSGTLNVTGPLPQTASSVINIDLGGTGTGQYDQLAVSGNASLGGSMIVNLVGGHTLATGQTYTVMTYASQTGTLNIPSPGGGLSWNVSYSPSLVLSIVDITPPTGTLSINGSASFTNDPAVTLAFTCFDAASSCSQMQISNDNVNYTGLASYATTTTWNLSSGDGPKTVFVKFQDGAGSLSSAVTATITLDTTPPEPSEGGSLDIWEWRNPLPQGNQLQEAAYGNGTFVLTGYNGTLLTSADGISWTMRTSGTSYILDSVAFGNGTFVAVGGAGTILTSSDGITWTNRTSGTASELIKVIFQNNQFVAVGAAGAIVTSPDGVTWTARTSNTANDIFGVAFGNGIFVASGYNGTILTSSDNGVTWTNSTSGTTNWLTDAAFGNNTFVVTVYNGTVLTSSDGLIWTSHSTGQANWIYGVAFDGIGTFMAVGDSGTILSSTDGISWTPKSSGITDNLSSVSFANNLYIATGWPNVILTSADGSAWNNRTTGSKSDLAGMTYGNNTFVAVGSGGAVLSSVDGNTWTSATSPTTNNLKDVTFGNGTFVSVGVNGAVISSSDGMNWSAADSGTTIYDPYGVAFGNNMFVAVGGGIEGAMGYLTLTSPDGINWAMIDHYSDYMLYDVAFGNGLFVAVGYQGTIMTSSNGTTWTLGPSGVTTDLYGITFANNMFISVGASGTILTSADGVDWSPASSPTSSDLRGIAFGNNTFLAAGSSTILSSTDGTNWNERTMDVTTNGLNAVAVGGDTALVAGNYGTILGASMAPGGTVSIFVNGGTGRTASPAVSLTLTCTDIGSGCAEMQFSDDGISYTTPETRAPSRSWNLPSGDGLKTVYAKFKDNAGNWSAAYSDTVLLDTVPPLVSSVTPTAGAANIPVDTAITATFSEDMDQTTIASSFIVTGVTGTVGYDGLSKTATFTPSSSLATGTTYTATLSTGAQDLAGNGLAADYSWNFTTVTSATITATTGAGGSISPTGAVSVNYGADQAFTITPGAGYHITGILIDGVSQNIVSSYTFTTVTANHTIDASFGIDTFLITANIGTGGSINPSPSITVNYGSDQTFTITPNTGYHIIDVLIDGISQGIISAYTFTSVTASHTIDASFAINTYTITASATTGGTVSPSGPVSVNHGSSQSFTITPLAGYYVADVLADGVSVGAVLSYSFSSVAANHTISAVFAATTAPPSFSSTSPAADSVISNARVGYTLDKDVASGTVTFTWTGGVTDLVSARTYTFTETSAGSHTADTGLTLVNGAIYTVTFQATDSQGNTASVPNANITYDETIPSVAITGPVSNSRVNTARISYTLSETVTGGTITIIQTGGTTDALSPYTYPLSSSELTAGGHTIDTGKALVNGAIYTFEIGNMVDTAGNTSATALSTNIEFDNQSVVITVTSPSTKAIISSATVTYSLSESAQSGTITFTRTAGSQDTASPQVYTMQTADLSQGTHSLSTGITLVDGAFYTVSFTATDLVANPATSVSNAKVNYATGYDPVHPWNVDNSGALNSVDEADVQKVFHAFGSRPGDTYWNPVCDLDKNNMVDGKDMMILQQHYGETW